MSDFAEQLRQRFNATPPEPTLRRAKLYAAYEEAAKDPAFASKEELQGFTFDQYDGSALGFYVEIDAPSLEEATARLKDMVSELEPINVPLGSIDGKPVTARVIFHSDGVRPGYFKHRRRW